jgi:hypothetical protein
MHVRKIRVILAGIALVAVASCGDSSNDDFVDPTVSTSVSLSTVSSSVPSTSSSSTWTGSSTTTVPTPESVAQLHAQLNAARATRIEAFRVDFEATRNLGDARVLALRVARGIDAYTGFISDQQWPESAIPYAREVVSQWGKVREPFVAIYDLPKNAEPEDMNVHIDAANEAQNAATEADEALAAELSRVVCGKTDCP